ADSGRVPQENAYFTGYYLSEAYALYSNGFERLHIGENANSQLPVELFAGHVRDVRSYQTAITNNVVYRDTDHKQSMIKNIIADTSNKKVYLLINDKMTVLSYTFGTPNGVTQRSRPFAASQALAVRQMPNSSMLTIVLPYRAASSSVKIFNLKGRRIHLFDNVTTDAVLWNPPSRGCFLVDAVCDGKRFARRIVVR
ncbi:MAG: hypothetical protein JXA71_12405, partial [Chitinispirillaceae bacterium]|nr:hypothetical protein [Chitinispirillaceae bacterium]